MRLHKQRKDHYRETSLRTARSPVLRYGSDADRTLQDDDPGDLRRRRGVFVRDYEHEIARQVCGLGPSVVSTGGGMLTFDRNGEILAKSGTIFYIDRPFEDCYRNLALHPERPLFKNHTKEEIENTYLTRRGLYKKYAKYNIPNTGSRRTRRRRSVRFYSCLRTQNQPHVFHYASRSNGSHVTGFCFSSFLYFTSVPSGFLSPLVFFSTSRLVTMTIWPQPMHFKRKSAPTRRISHSDCRRDAVSLILQYRLLHIPFSMSPVA